MLNCWLFCLFWSVRLYWSSLLTFIGIQGRGLEGPFMSSNLTPYLLMQSCHSPIKWPIYQISLWASNQSRADTRGATSFPIHLVYVLHFFFIILLSILYFETSFLLPPLLLFPPSLYALPEKQCSAARACCLTINHFTDCPGKWGRFLTAGRKQMELEEGRVWMTEAGHPYLHSWQGDGTNNPGSHF